jgi:hypothetical protein
MFRFGPASSYLLVVGKELAPRVFQGAVQRLELHDFVPHLAFEI